MREIGGYIELETFRGRMLHEEATKLNCGRNALAYLWKQRKSKNFICRIFSALQFWMCAKSSVFRSSFTM